jgi:chromosome segregation ATPase
MTDITSRIGAVVAGLIALVLAIACTVEFFELRSVRGDNETLQQQAHTDSQSIGTLNSQLTTSQADLAQATAGAKACSASVAEAASEASAVRANAVAAQAKAARESVNYQQRIDALTQRLQDPANQSETCDAAFNRLRSGL